MKSTRYLLLLGLLILLAVPSYAQDTFTEYIWESGNLAFRYPDAWDAPLEASSPDSDRVNLFLAQTLVDQPDTRPPAIPFITLSIVPPPTPNEEGEIERVALYDTLAADLAAVDIDAIGSLPGVLLGQQSIATRGVSSDGELFGIGQAIELDAERGSLIIYGRSPAVQRDNFVALFNTLISSLALTSAEATHEPQYGVLWHQSRTLQDGPDAFLDIRGIALSEDGSTLYAVDNIIGLLTMDAVTGLVTSTQAFDSILDAQDIAVAPDGTVYIADLACNCLRTILDGTVGDIIDGFSEDDPVTVAVSDTTVYTTDTVDQQVVLRAYEDGAAPRDSLFEDQDLFIQQPHFAVNQFGTLFVFDDDTLYQHTEDDTFDIAFTLPIDATVTDFAISLTNQFIFTTVENGILITDNAGRTVSQFGDLPSDSEFPQAGEMANLTGVAVSPTGVIYSSDSDGSYGNLTAFGFGIETGRVGTTNLQNNVPVSGNLTPDITRQFWTFTGTRGEVITLSAIADPFSDLDLSLRLLDPAGNEIAFVEEDIDFTLFNPFDPQLDNFVLPADGEYIVIVESAFGTGSYDLGLNIAQEISFGEEDSISYTGAISEAIPVQSWVLAASAGETVTITMSALSGTLDPILIVLQSNGDILDENDDAFDPTLGFDAQVEALRLPLNGNYIIEATRFDGTGNYELTIERE